MTVDQVRAIDFIRVDATTNEVWLTISDHLPWEAAVGQHIELLQKKIYSYLDFIESGEIFDKAPESKGMRIVIDVVGAYAPNHAGEVFLKRVGQYIASQGYELRTRVLW